jgi:hypothetical protein
MALINCKIVEDVTADQVYGTDGISSYELFIKPDDGYYLAAKDFTDYTFETFGSAVQSIIDFGDTGKLILADTTTAYADDNEVKVTVNFYSTYSITEDTIIDIDIDGQAYPTKPVERTISIVEGVSTVLAGYDTGTVQVITEPGVVEGSLIQEGAGPWNQHLVRHPLTFSGLVGTEIKIATIILNAVQDSDTSTVHYLKPRYWAIASVSDWILPGTTGDGVRLEYTEYPSIGDEDVSISTENGEEAQQKLFEVFYTPSEVETTSVKTYIASKVMEANAPVRSAIITNVTTDLGSLPSGSSNVIPDSGITNSNPPIVRVFGTPGSTFKIEFRESKVVDGGDTSRSTITGSNDFFNGEIPNMPEGFVTIPSSGVYSFKMPNVASFTTSGWKEFEMKITSGVNTIIKSSAVKTGGTSTNIGAYGSIVTNKFYQYPKVNVTFAAAALPSNWSHTHSDYSVTTQLTSFGGSANKTGVPLMPPSSNAKLPSTTRVVNFEIRVKNDTAGVFSFDSSNITNGTFDKSQFVASVLDNGDVVTFSNLKAYIGEGTSDTSVDKNKFFTITGTIRCKKFGYQNQTYTIDLSELFNFA